MIPFVKTETSISVILKGKFYTLSDADDNFETVVNLCRTGGTEDEVLNVIEAKARKVAEAASKTEHFVITKGQVFFQDEPVEEFINKKILAMAEEGFDLRPMEQFLLKLANNPSNRIVTRLYRFLEVGKLPITEDGDFLAYKAVRGDYKDIHSGTFDNSIGAKPTMRRNKVDEDDNRTCSAGLHVCSFEYLPSFSHADGHVMVCKVSPQDVVSIPVDYNDTKMRVCAYEVVGEYSDYYKEHPMPAWNSSVASDDDYYNDDDEELDDE